MTNKINSESLTSPSATGCSECRRRAHRWNTRCRKGAELTSADIRCYRSLAASLSIMSQHAIVRRPMRVEG